MLHFVEALRQSPAVKQVQVIDFIDEATVKYLKCRAECQDGSILQIEESFIAGKINTRIIGRMCSSDYSFAGTMPRLIPTSPPFLIIALKAARYLKACEFQLTTF